MTLAGLLYETLHRLGSPDPAALLTLPDPVVRAHIAHTRNHWTGRYDPPTKKRRGRRPLVAPTKQIAEFHASQANGPRRRDVATARQVLKMAASGATLPEALVTDARHTLRRAGKM